MGAGCAVRGKEGESIKLGATREVSRIRERYRGSVIQEWMREEK